MRGRRTRRGAKPLLKRASEHSERSAFFLFFALFFLRALFDFAREISYKVFYFDKSKLTLPDGSVEHID